MSGVLSNGWVQGFGVAAILSLAGLTVAVYTQTGVPVAEVSVVSTVVPTLLSAAIVWYRSRGAVEPREAWEAVANKFEKLPNRPIPIRAEWMYTIETKHYDWTVRHSSDVSVALCIEICKEAERLLLVEPSFRKKFPDIAAVADDGDRWLVAVYKITKMGQVTVNASSVTFGVKATGEGGEIKDLPRASEVLCQRALNGF